MGTAGGASLRPTPVYPVGPGLPARRGPACQGMAAHTTVACLLTLPVEKRFENSLEEDDELVTIVLDWKQTIFVVINLLK